MAKDMARQDNAPKGPPMAGRRIAKGNAALEPDQAPDEKRDGEVVHERRGAGAPQGGQIRGRQGDQEGIRR